MPKNSFRRIGDCKTPSFLCSWNGSLWEAREFLTIRGDFGIFKILKETNCVFETFIREISAKRKILITS